MLPAQSTDKNAPAWLTRAIEIFDRDARKDGDMLSHDWIKHALDVPVATKLDQVEKLQWMLIARLDAFRDYLLVARKVALENIRGEGYRIVPPHEQARFAVNSAMKLVKKGLDQGEKLIVNTRVADLTHEESKRHTDAYIRLCGIGDLMRRQRRDIFKLFLPKPATPDPSSQP